MFSNKYFSNEQTKYILRTNETYIFCAVIVFNPWAFVSNKFVTSLMDHADTNLALVALFTQPPNKITTMGAKCRLSQESCHEFV